MVPHRVRRTPKHDYLLSDCVRPDCGHYLSVLALKMLQHFELQVRSNWLPVYTMRVSSTFQRTSDTRPSGRPSPRAAGSKHEELLGRLRESNTRSPTETSHDALWYRECRCEWDDCCTMRLNLRSWTNYDTHLRACVKSLLLSYLDQKSVR